MELKQILARQPGPEVAEQLSIYQQTLKEKTKQMKGMSSELNMYEAQVKEYKYEIERLAKELQEVKKKFYMQKRKEQQARYSIHVSHILSMYQHCISYCIRLRFASVSFGVTSNKVSSLNIHETFLSILCKVPRLVCTIVEIQRVSDLPWERSLWRGGGAKWPPITASALSRRSYRKIGDCRQSIFCHAFGFLINVPFLFQGARSRLPTGRRTRILSSKIRWTKIYWWRFQSKATSKSCRLIVEQSICK